MTIIRQEFQKLSLLIENKMKQEDLSLREFAEKCGLSHSYIRNIKKGFDPRSGKQISPTVETLEKLSAGLDLTLHQLLKMTGFTLSTANQSLETKTCDDKKPKDLEKILEQHEIMFRDIPLNDEDKEDIKNILEIMYKRAKQKNKKKTVKEK